MFATGAIIRTQARIHGLLHYEAQRFGYPSRAIVGGASQGCCVALDTTMAYSVALSEVIGLAGHAGCGGEGHCAAGGHWDAIFRHEQGPILAVGTGSRASKPSLT